MKSNKMLKKSIQDFFSSLRRGAGPRLAPFFKHWRVRKMAVGPSTASQDAEKRAFQHPAEPYYRHHVFFCVNRRDDGSACCANHDARALRDYAKARIKELGLAGRGGVRINQAGCLDRCAEGPIIVVYPEGTWYTYVDRSDIDEIVDRHLLHGHVVERLKI